LKLIVAVYPSPLLTSDVPRQLLTYGILGNLMKTIVITAMRTLMMTVMITFVMKMLPIMLINNFRNDIDDSIDHNNTFQKQKKLLTTPLIIGGQYATSM
jgi:hypothetical protein